MDGRNVYELCDYIVPYEISLKDAINKGLLVPFHYYGIYDETVDYSDIKIVNGRYDERELNKKLLIQSKHNLIYGHYMKYPSVAVHSGISGEHTQERVLALQDLKVGKIKVIFSVDMFNEGVDLPFVDMVMFLRPTESPVVFLQQP